MAMKGETRVTRRQAYDVSTTVQYNQESETYERQPEIPKSARNPNRFSPVLHHRSSSICTTMLCESHET